MGSPDIRGCTEYEVDKLIQLSGYTGMGYTSANWYKHALTDGTTYTFKQEDFLPSTE